MNVINNAVLNHISQSILDGRFHLMRYLFIMLIMAIFLVLAGFKRILKVSYKLLKPYKPSGRSDQTKSLKFS